MDNYSLFQDFALNKHESRDASRKALAVGSRRVDTQYRNFIESAATPQERESRFGLITADLQQMAIDLCEQYSHDDPEVIYETLASYLGQALPKVARRPKMCPYHREITDLSLMLKDPQSAFSTMAQHQFSDSSCRGGFDGTCNWTPDMVTQEFWDSRQQQQDDRALERQMAPAPPAQPTQFQPDVQEDSPDYQGPEITEALETAPSAVGVGEQSLEPAMAKRLVSNDDDNDELQDNDSEKNCSSCGANLKASEYGLCSRCEDRSFGDDKESKKTKHKHYEGGGVCSSCSDGHCSGCDGSCSCGSCGGSGGTTASLRVADESYIGEPWNRCASCGEDMGPGMAGIDKQSGKAICLNCRAQQYGDNNVIPPHPNLAMNPLGPNGIGRMEPLNDPRWGSTKQGAGMGEMDPAMPSPGAGAEMQPGMAPQHPQPHMAIPEGYQIDPAALAARQQGPEAYNAYMLAMQGPPLAPASDASGGMVPRQGAPMGMDQPQQAPMDQQQAPMGQDPSVVPPEQCPHCKRESLTGQPCPYHYQEMGAWDPNEFQGYEDTMPGEEDYAMRPGEGAHMVARSIHRQIKAEMDADTIEEHMSFPAQNGKDTATGLSTDSPANIDRSTWGPKNMPKLDVDKPKGMHNTIQQDPNKGTEYKGDAWDKEDGRFDSFQDPVKQETLPSSTGDGNDSGFASNNMEDPQSTGDVWNGMKRQENPVTRDPGATLSSFLSSDAVAQALKDFKG